MSHIKTKLYVFGGQADTLFMNDLWVFDLHSCERSGKLYIWYLVLILASDAEGTMGTRQHGTGQRFGRATATSWALVRYGWEPNIHVRHGFFFVSHN